MTDEELDKLDEEISFHGVPWLPKHTFREIVRLARIGLKVEEEQNRLRWQCSGCKLAFPGKYQRVCPACGREDYWSGSVSPSAKRWEGK